VVTFSDLDAMLQKSAESSRYKHFLRSALSSIERLSLLIRFFWLSNTPSYFATRLSKCDYDVFCREEDGATESQNSSIDQLYVVERDVSKKQKSKMCVIM